MARLVSSPRATALPLQRESAQYPGLVLEWNPPFLVFRHGRTCEVFDLTDGVARCIASSRASYDDLERYIHVREVAMAYAKTQAAKCRRHARVNVGPFGPVLRLTGGWR